MKMNLTVHIEVEGEDAAALLETLLAQRNDPLEPTNLKPGTVGYEFVHNKGIEIDLTDHSREGGVAYRVIRWHVAVSDEAWLRDMPWNTFLLELKSSYGGKVKRLRNIGPVAIAALRAVLLGADTKLGDDNVHPQ
jgi:glycine cleavage system aminomethyltransferase T